MVRALRVAGIVLLLGGLGHTGGVLFKWTTKGFPDGHHIAFILFITFIHWTAGSLDLIAARALAVGESSARAILAVTTGLLVAYGVTLSPLVHGFFHVPPVLYPLAHVLMLARSRAPS